MNKHKQTQAYRRGLIKTAGAGTQWVLDNSLSSMADSVVPGLGTVAASAGKFTGLLQDKVTPNQIKALGRGASLAIPGKAAYNRIRRRIYAAGSTANALKPSIGAVIRGAIGAYIGSKLSGDPMDIGDIDSMANLVDGDLRSLSLDGNLRTLGGAGLGTLVALSPQLVGWLASWFAKPRTKAQQEQSNKSSRLLKGMLIPGYAGYVNNLDARSAQGIADEQLAQQEAKKKQKEQKS